jgi:hypothetical protein
VCADEVAACLSGDGTPLVVTDALRDWHAAREWTPELLRRRYGRDAVRSSASEAVLSLEHSRCLLRR